ncbi:MAG: phytanoyl-CoA dioxygenase family protein [Pseudonocardiaceae bacterium]
MACLKDELRFYAAKAREFRARRVDPGLTDHPGYLSILRRDGIVFVEDFIGSERIARIIDEIRTRTDLMGDRLSPDIVKRNARYLLIDPAARLPSTRVFFDSALVSGLARAYLSKDAIPDRPAVQLKADIGEKSIVDFYHIDEWRYLLSAFLLLTDVGPDEAPMMYLKGSHRPRPWRIRKEQEFYFYYDRGDAGEYANEESPYCGCYLPTEVRRLRERYGYESVTCTGRAGTLMLFDNLGLHRASPLRRNSRLLLSSYWMLPRSA